ncbi:MAG: hypothetical protein ABIP50_01195 [Candidatus Saccharimonadales bacterium]
MKLPARLLVVGILATIFMAVFAVKDSYAQASLTDDQLHKISVNCVSIKNTLNQLHATDALLRVNRGQIYEAMSTKLMDRFNTRLASNGLDATGTVAVTVSYRSALDTFRTDYQSYERQMTTAIRTDCSKKPGDFYAAVEDARTKRNKVHADVLKLHQYIDDYRSAVNDFYINFARVRGE